MESPTVEEIVAEECCRLIKVRLPYYHLWWERHENVFYVCKKRWKADNVSIRILKISDGLINVYPNRGYHLASPDAIERAAEAAVDLILHDANHITRMNWYND